MTPADASDLCVSCGLCCNGGLFDRAPITAEEVSRLPPLGLQVRDGGHRAVFALPCPRLEGTCCTIYADRPERCRAFACALLGRLAAGTMTPDAAHGHVRDTHAALARVAALAPESLPVDARIARLKAAADWPAIADPQAKRHEAQVYLAILAAEKLLDAHFRRPEQAVIAAPPAPQ